MVDLDTSSGEQSQSKGEFLDAVRRHICQILGFDFGFIDVVVGAEIKNVASFCFDDEADVAGEFVEALLDENKQPVTTANTQVAQNVKNSKRSWVGKAFSVEDLEKGLDEETEGFPYMIVPVLSNPGAGDGEVTGLIRVISFDASREITSQDMMTLKLMGEHLASRTGLFGEFTASAASSTSTAKPRESDNVLIVHSNRLVRRRFNRILGSQYHVIESESSEKALETLDDTRVDVILVDSELQGASGFGFCKVLKESTKWKHIPVILVVTENSTTARVEGLNVGADDCIPDSCFDAELLARVSSSLRHRKSERELAIQYQLLEDYSKRLEKAHEQLSIDRQTTIQRNSQLEQMKREGEVQRHQDNLLHRISNIIRKSFNIRENLEEMLEALSGWFSLDCTYIVMPNDAEPEDTIRVECVSDKAYKVVAYDRDLDIYEIFKKNFQADQSIISNDAASDRRLDPFHKILKSGFSIQSLFLIPITYEQKLQGLLVGYKCAARANWSRINETFMKSVVDQVAVGVVNARLYATVQRQATTDGLTGLYNHRTGQEKLADQMKLSERYQRRISVIMLDVDHFKSINDTYGHPAGDSVLKSVAKTIRNNCRDVDIPVRYGGEEFLLVLPEVTQDGATVVAERIRVALKSETIKHEELEINITGSFGVACFPDDADNQQYLLDLADKALYLSKRLGRDQVHTAADLMFEPAEDPEKKTEDVAKNVRDGSFTPPMVSEEARQHEELVPEVVDMVKSLAASLYAKSEYNKQHHLEVARMSELLAKVMGLSAQQVEQIRVAGLLHDVGVLQLPQELLHKEGELTREEREQVNQHATLGAQMLRPVRALKDICEILENHHERWDGTGYPRGLKGEAIPLPARIVAIVDSYHAMISERPYRPAMTHEEALKVLKEGAGKQWDPFLIEIFSAVMKSMRETTQEVQAKVALAATLAKAGVDPSGEAGRAAAAPAGAAAQTSSTREDTAAAQSGSTPQGNAAQAGAAAEVASAQTDTSQAAPNTVTGDSSAADTETKDDVIHEAEQRTEPSKISSIIGPVIKPVAQKTETPSDERTGSQSLLKFVEEATEATTRSDEIVPITVALPTPPAESTRVQLPASDDNPSGQQNAYRAAPNIVPHPVNQQSSAPQVAPATADASSKTDEGIAGLPEKRGFGVPVATGQLSNLVGQNLQAQATNGAPAQPGTPPHGQPGMPPQGQPVMPPQGQPGMPPQGLAGMPPQGQPGMPPQGQPGMPPQGQPGMPPQGRPGMPPQGQPGMPPQGQPGMPPQGQPGMPPQGQPGMPPQGQPGMPPQGQPGMPPQGQPGMPPQRQPGMPPQGQPGMPPQRQPGMPPQGQPGMPPPGPGTSNTRLPAQMAPGMSPPGPGSSNSRIPAQPPAAGVPSGMPQGAPGSSYNRLPQQSQMPGQAPQSIPAAPGQPNIQAAAPMQSQLTASQELPGYPRPYAAGQPVPYAAPGLGAQTPSVVPQSHAPQPQAVPHAQGMAQQQQPIPQAQSVAPQQQNVAPLAPQVAPQPSPASMAPSQPRPAQVQQQMPGQPVPGLTQSGQMSPVNMQQRPPAGQPQTAPQTGTTGGATKDKQPDTWDPYSDYDDEDEMEGGI